MLRDILEKEGKTYLTQSLRIHVPTPVAVLCRGGSGSCGEGTIFSVYHEQKGENSHGQLKAL